MNEKKERLTFSRFLICHSHSVAKHSVERRLAHTKVLFDIYLAFPAGGPNVPPNSLLFVVS